MIVVGIAGGSGSGKTTVVRELMKFIPSGRISLLPQDAYYKDHGHLTPAEKKKVNFDHPDALEFSLLVEHIRELKAGRPVLMPTYDYLTCTRLSETVEVRPAEVLLVEGILILTQGFLRDEIDIKVFVDADDDDRLGRIIERDMAERGRDVQEVLTRYRALVKPMYLQFIEPTKRYADIIIPEGGRNDVAIRLLASMINGSGSI